MDYIRRTYQVPAKRGGRIKYKGKLGTITGSRGGYLRIRLDGESWINSYHPTFAIEYLS